VRDRQFARIAPTPEAEAAWTQHVADGGRQDSPDAGQLPVRGSEHSRQGPILAHQSGHRPRDAGQARRGRGEGLPPSSRKP
jgi:hypothetical protein